MRFSFLLLSDSEYLEDRVFPSVPLVMMDL
jgi:hypothetical protein